jgi:hypothetical protein
MNTKKAGWDMQATNKARVSICVELDTLPIDNYAIVCGKQAYHTLILRLGNREKQLLRAF